MMSKYFKNYKKVYSIILVMLLILVFLSGCGGKSNQKIESVEQLNDSSISLLLAPGSASSTTALEKFPDAKHSYITSLPDAYLSIQNGNADAFVYDDLCMRAALAEGDMNDLTIMDESLAAVDIVVGLNPEQDELLTKVNEFIRQMKEDGTLADMERRWIDEGSETMPDIPKAENPTTTLHFGTSGLIRPMNYVGENNTLTGFDVELLRRMALYLNVDYTLEHMSFEALTASLQSGRLDIVASQLNVTEERREVLLLSEPYVTSETKVMLRKDRLAQEEIQLTDMSQLNGKHLGTVNASVYIPHMQEEYPDSKITQFTSHSDGIQALRSGKIDAYILGTAEAKPVIAQMPEIKALDGGKVEDQLGFIFPLHHTALQQEFNDALAQLREQGVLTQLEEKWFSGDDNVSVIIPELSGASKGMLSVACSFDSKPFSYIANGVPAGYDVELLYTVAAMCGYELDIVSQDFGAMLAGISSGKSDVGIGCITYTEVRAESMLFTDTTYNDGICAIVMSETAESSEGFFSNLLASFDRTLIRENRWKIVLDGLLVTLMLGILSMLFGTLLGFLYSFPLRSKNRFIKRISGIISTILDRVPLLVILMVLYYIIFAKSTLPAVAIGVFGFTISFANSVAGILNTGIMAVDKGELEAATAMGYSKWQVFTKISFPQAVNQMFGSYASSVVALINGTSIIGYITVQDLTKASDIIRGSTYEAFFPLFLTAALYFIITSIFVAVLSVLAKKLDPKHRKRQVKGV